MKSVELATPTAADWSDFQVAVERSRALHADWVQPPDTAEAFAAYLEKATLPVLRPFLVRRTDDRALVGVINISNIIGEPLSSAFLGFYAFEPHARRGYMRAGLQLALRHAFDDLKLHRVEANIQPTNTASLSFVRKLGFRREGFSPKYLRIAGEWRDHERWVLLAEEFEAVRGS